MAESIQIITLGERERWIEVHRREGLPSQSWDYARALSASAPPPRLAVVEPGGARMLLPIFEREWNGARDITTILGLYGVSVLPASAAPLARWREYAASEGWVAGYLQMSTVAASDDSLFWQQASGTGSLLHGNQVYLLPIRSGDVLPSCSEIIRRKVRRAEQDGACLVENKPALADSLKNFYPQAMKRVGARACYEFSEATLDLWVQSPGMIALGASVNGSIEAVSLFCFAGEQAEYHLNACSERGRSFAAWLILQAIRRLQSLGVATLNLGGGVSPGDSLAFFKERFNGTCRKLTSVCQIYDPEKYDLLCQQAGVGRDACYFPAYRAPRERMAATVPIVGEPAAAGKGDSDQNTMLSQSQSCLN